MLGIGSAHRGVHPVVVADIEDGGVAVAVVGLCHGAPAIVYMAERAERPMEERTPDQSAAGIGTLLSETADKVVKAYMASDAGKKHGAPADAYAVVHAPWTRLRTAFADEAYSSETTITKEKITALAQKALKTIQPDQSQHLEAGTMKVFLNGYPTANPVGKTARSMGIVAFESTIDQAVRQDVTAALGRILPGRTVTIHSGMRSLLSVIQEHVPDAMLYIVIDVHAQTTTSSVVLKEEVLDETTVPIGTATIIKLVSPSTSVPEETVSLMRMLAMDACSSTACQELRVALAKAEPDMVKTFADMFATLAKVRSIPNVCIMSVRREFAPWLTSFFSRIDFAQFTTTTQPFNIEVLTPDRLQDVVTWNTGVSTDTGIGLAAACVNILRAR